MNKNEKFAKEMKLINNVNYNFGQSKNELKVF